MKTTKLGENVRKYRKIRGYSQQQLADKMGKKSYTTIQKWESGKIEPPMKVLKRLSYVLGVSVDELYGEIDAPIHDGKYDWLIEKWTRLDEIGRKLVVHTIETECFRADEVRRLKSDESIKYMRLPLFDLPVSAGDGMHFEDYVSHEYIEVEADKIPNGALYLLTVKGKSMLPQYAPGDLIFVRPQTYISEGEIGVFSVNSKGYLKKAGKGKLISLNPDYDDIVISEYDSYYPRGIVLGKYVSTSNLKE